MVKGKNINVLKRIAIVQSIVNEKYEVGNQSKSKRQVWRHHVNAVYPMGERTFYRYINTDVEREMAEIDKRQLKIEFSI